VKLVSGFQARGNGGDVCINADEVVGLTERHVVGGVYCEVHTRPGVRLEVWGTLAEVRAKLEGKSS
jgi:hypothetical protein